jgi:hypothetical protein
MSFREGFLRSAQGVPPQHPVAIIKELFVNACEDENWHILFWSLNCLRFATRRVDRPCHLA